MVAFPVGSKGPLGGTRLVALWRAVWVFFRVEICPCPGVFISSSHLHGGVLSCVVNLTSALSSFYPTRVFWPPFIDKDKDIDL